MDRSPTTSIKSAPEIRADLKDSYIFLFKYLVSLDIPQMYHDHL
jgi:hypothetical protein